MNQKIRKVVRKSRKHYFRTFTVLNTNEDAADQIGDILAEFGLKVYLDPNWAGNPVSDKIRFFVSNKTLTVKWYINRQKTKIDKARARRYFQGSRLTDELETN